MCDNAVKMSLTCNACNKRFARMDNLSRHLRTSAHVRKQGTGEDTPVVNTASSIDEETDDSEDGSESSEEETGEMIDEAEDDSESSDEELGKESDRDIKEIMADVMYICCQRPEKRQEMLEKADSRLVKCICECAEKVLKGDIPINYNEKDALIQHRNVMRKLADPGVSGKCKKKIIVQNGGNFLLSLIPTVVGALAGMFQ